MLISSETIINRFVSKIVDEIVDMPGNTIRDVIKNSDKNRKAKTQNIETRIYQIIIDTINEFTGYNYKEQDVLYDAAECIIKGFKRNPDNTEEAVKSGLKALVPKVENNTCANFLRVLSQEISKDENNDLYKEIILIQHEQTIKDMHTGFQNNERNHEETHNRLAHVEEKIGYIKENIQEYMKGENHQKIQIKSRAKEYSDKWHKNVFLNDFNKRDKNAGANIKLKDIYLEKQLPHYKWKTDNQPSYDMKELLSEYIVDKDGKKMLLILGHPGIGKSTLITWIMANLPEKDGQIFVYQFAHDLKNLDWQRKDILNEIFETLNLSYEESENITLILDGFDEIHVNGDRERILNKINQELKEINFLKNFSLIITCRENYVNPKKMTGTDYITLQAWNEEQIKSFCEIYEKKSTRNNPETINNKISQIKINKITEQKEIFGIPLILYMVLALNVDIGKSSSIVDIYDQIFSLKRGGIYDRCYQSEHRINTPEIKEHIQRISQRIAFWIFENHDDAASIPQEKFEEICDNEINTSPTNIKDIQSDVLIGNYFKLIKHCEGVGTDELQFIHRSIYEYFVTLYFFDSIHQLNSKEKVAGKLGEFLKDGRLSRQILEFIKCKFDSMKKYNLADVTKEVFEIMLQDGMTYHIGKPVLNVMDREMNIFANMLEVVHLWNDKSEKHDQKINAYLHFNNSLTNLNLHKIDFSKANLSRVLLTNADLIQSNLTRTNLADADLTRANLTRANLTRADLTRADLTDADLIHANLTRANLTNTDLTRANLTRANLTRANLTRANLTRANLTNANLTNANLIRADLTHANLTNANLTETIFNEKHVDILHNKCRMNESKIFLTETSEVISYKEYCARKQKKRY